MWNTESCPENKFIVAGSYISDYHDSLGRSRPLKVGDQVHFIRNSRRLNGTQSGSFSDSFASDLGGIQMLIGGPFQSDTGKLIIQKDMVEKCGEVNYDVRYKVCDRCGSNHFVRPKKETWKCCAGEKPYDPKKSTILLRCK
ncbi:unnamed protein product [Porites lobata]|uniref:Uncharacterized protein n=1 Tax=Porites lobata TaxID=104759 RepID=A0ABN8S290_9CNID|nr:unnamed protein product [Porites lobata]